MISILLSDWYYGTPGGAARLFFAERALVRGTPHDHELRLGVDENAIVHAVLAAAGVSEESLPKIRRTADAGRSRIDLVWGRKGARRVERLPDMILPEIMIAVAERLDLALEVRLAGPCPGEPDLVLLCETGADGETFSLQVGGDITIVEQGYRRFDPASLIVPVLEAAGLTGRFPDLSFKAWTSDDDHDGLADSRGVTVSWRSGHETRSLDSESLTPPHILGRMLADAGIPAKIDLADDRGRPAAATDQVNRDVLPERYVTAPAFEE